MEREMRRNGFDRRVNTVEVLEDRRKGTERRDMLNYFKAFEDIMKNIPMFKSLVSAKIHKIFSVCFLETYNENHVLCKEGEKSNNLYILLEGKLKILMGETLIAYIDPKRLVGEIGFFTGKERSASVIVESTSNIIRINKIELNRIFNSDPDLYICVLLNVIDDLAYKLEKDNKVIANFIA